MIVRPSDVAPGPMPFNPISSGNPPSGAALTIDGSHDRAVQSGHGRVATGMVVGDRGEQAGPVGRGR